MESKMLNFLKKWDFPYVEFFWGPKKDRVVEGVLMGGGRP